MPVAMWVTNLPIALVVKIVLLLGGLSGAGWFVWDYINTKKNNALLESTVTSVTYVLSEYATRTQNEVQAYSHAVLVLGDRDTAARKDRDEKFSTIEGKNLTEMSYRKPDALLRLVNGRTAGMLDAISGAGTDGDTGGASAPASGPP